MSNLDEQRNPEFVSPENEARWATYQTLHDLGFNLVVSARNAKTPIMKFKEYRHQRVTQDQLDFWRCQFEDHNLLLLTGLNPINQFVVVEPDDEEAEAYLAAHLPPTPMMVRRASGKGFHRYYRRPDDSKWLPQILGHRIEGVNIRIDRKADGNYVVAPGSIHPSGELYEWTQVWTEDILEATPTFDPAWLPHEALNAPRNGSIDLDHESWANDQEMPLDERLERSRAYVRNTPGTTGKTGDGSADNAALRLAGKLVWGFALPAEDAIDLLMEEWAGKLDQVDDCGTPYPWTTKQIAHKVRTAITKADTYPGEPGDMIRPSDQERQAQWEDDRMASIFSARGTETETETETENKAEVEPDAEVEDPKAEDLHLDYLKGMGVKVLQVMEGEKPPTKTYLVECPCCDHYGAFTVNLRTTRRSYCCSGAKEIPWTRAIKENLVPKPKTPPFAVHRWSDLTRIAEAQSEDWFWPHWLEYGCLHMLTGRPFSGKSTMIMEMLAANFQGATWHGQAIDQCPVILFDFENRERKICSQINRCLDGNPGRIEDLLFRIPPVVVPRPLTPDFVRFVIDSIRETVVASGKNQGIILIDTFRSAFSAGADFNELDSSSMSRLLTPLKELALETGWAVFILHHNKKGKDEFYGDNAIAGVLDYLWNWQVGDENAGGKDYRILSVQGRSDAQRPLRFFYNASSGRNCLVREIEAEVPEDKADMQIRAILEALPLNPEKGLTQAVIQAATGIPEGSLRTRLIQAHKAGLVDSDGEGTKSKPKRYWLTTAGVAALNG